MIEYKGTFLMSKFYLIKLNVIDNLLFIKIHLRVLQGLLYQIALLYFDLSFYLVIFSVSHLRL